MENVHIKHNKLISPIKPRTLSIFLNAFYIGMTILQILTFGWLTYHISTDDVQLLHHRHNVKIQQIQRQINELQND